MRLLLVVLGVSESLIHSSPSEPRRAIFHDSQPGGIAQLVVRMHWQIRDPRAMRTCGEVDDTVAVGAQYLFAVGWTRSLSVVVLSLVRVIVARVIVAQVAVGPMLLSLGLNYSVLRLGAHVKITITCIFASKTFGSSPSDNRPSPPFRSVRRPICPGMTKKNWAALLRPPIRRDLYRRRSRCPRPSITESARRPAALAVVALIAGTARTPEQRERFY